MEDVALTGNSKPTDVPSDELPETGDNNADGADHASDSLTTSLSESSDGEPEFPGRVTGVEVVKGIPMITAEILQKDTPGVTLICPFRGPRPGTLFFTTYRLIFVPSESGASHISVPLCTIHCIEKSGRSSSRGEYSYCIEVVCKDMRTLRFALKQETRCRSKLYSHLMLLAFPLSSGRPLFCYEYKLHAVEQREWQGFDMKNELQRLDVPNKLWRLTSVNKDYELCDSYPSVFAVPAALTDKQLASVASFRSRSRVPALVWFNAETQASLSRCSQPLVGTLNKRNHDDELYVRLIGEANCSSSKVVLIDARPKRNAVANMALGGGYESEEHYPGIDLIFADIGNIHVMRDSLKKVRDLCYTPAEDSSWLSNLESTHWLDHIRLIIAGAVRIVDLIDRCRLSVVVHCSDGWDRTSQLTSIAMLLLDPFYRTLRGFQVLIEKEWLAFGHKFQQRCGHGDKKHSDEQRSPVFVQFIDVVWQLTQQFPSAFQFNNYFLITVLDHLYSCLFGTFLCNSEKARLAVRDRTVSLWSEVSDQSDEYLNPLYTTVAMPTVLYPVAALHRIQLWMAYYARWNPRMRPQEDIQRRAMDLHRACRQLEMQVQVLQSQLSRSASVSTGGAPKPPKKGSRGRADATLSLMRSLPINQ